MILAGESHAVQVIAWLAIAIALWLVLFILIYLTGCAPRPVLHLESRCIRLCKKRKGWHWTRIQPNLVLGSLPRWPWALEELRMEEGIGAVLSLNASWELGLSAACIRDDCGIDMRQLPTPDFFAPTQPDIREAVAFIKKHLDKGQGVYVHCNGGKGRSAVCVICYLIYANGWSADYAFEFVRSRRKIANMRSCCGVRPQWRAVKRFEREFQATQATAKDQASRSAKDVHQSEAVRENISKLAEGCANNAVGEPVWTSPPDAGKRPIRTNKVAPQEASVGERCNVGQDTPALSAVVQTVAGTQAFPIPAHTAEVASSSTAVPMVPDGALVSVLEAEPAVAVRQVKAPALPALPPLGVTAQEPAPVSASDVSSMPLLVAQANAPTPMPPPCAAMPAPAPEQMSQPAAAAKEQGPVCVAASVPPTLVSAAAAPEDAHANGKGDGAGGRSNDYEEQGSERRQEQAAEGSRKQMDVETMNETVQETPKEDGLASSERSGSPVAWPSPRLAVAVARENSPEVDLS